MYVGRYGIDDRCDRDDRMAALAETNKLGISWLQKKQEGDRWR